MTVNHHSPLGDPVFESITHDPRHSFFWHVHGYPSPVAKWNYHPEYELHLIRHSSGHYMVGDHIDRFEPGNLVLVGPNLPHAWFSDLDHGATAIERRDVVLQFRGEWFESLVRVCPELRHTLPLIAASSQGLEFTGVHAAKAAALLQSMEYLDDVGRVARLIELLERLTHCAHKPLASPHYCLEHIDLRSDQVDAVLQYVHQHFDRRLSMADIAARQGMTPSTFSRFFKRSTGDTFVAFVRRLRIDYACRLLLDDSQSVAEVCFQVGYGNLSNFNRHFRRATGHTPRAYRLALRGQ